MIPNPTRSLLAALLMWTGAAMAQEAATIAPNANLHVEGIPAIPASLAEAVNRYNDFRGHGFVAWHPKQREMLVAHRKQGANTTQIFRLSRPMGELEQLTDDSDPISGASYEPLQGRYIVFERASGGNEVAQLYRLDGKGKAPVLLTNVDERNNMSGWLRKSSRLLYTSVPIDRTASGGSRAEIKTQLWLMDPEKPAGRRRVAEFAGGGWSLGAVSRDDRQLVITERRSINESRLWLMDLASGEKRQILPAPDGKADAAEQASYRVAGFSVDGKALFVVTDQFGEFNELARLNLASGQLDRVTAHIPWDVVGGNLSEDGQRIVIVVNADGKRELHFLDAKTLKELKKAPALPEGSITTARFDKRRGELALSVNGAQGPSQLYSLDAQGHLQAWTRAFVPAGVDTSRFSEQQVVRWKSFDGRTISGLLSKPPAERFPGKRPVLISIHGGPEGQASIGFLGRNQYYMQELGVALIQPNVRGSTGYGKTFLSLDNGFKREDSVKDIGALFEWIATQPDLDASRVMVTGGSYGGYMTLAVATNYPDRITSALDVVGISNFLSFLKNTESYRRDLRRVEYGDERDPAMHDFLDKISPLTNAARIKKPLFVVQGRNDPRVPYTEAEQIVAKVRENGTPVWYLRAANEGHGFARKENADYQFYSTILFMQETLLK